MPHTDPSLSIAQRIDLACDRFESEWKAGKHPRITDFVSAARESDRVELRQALLAIELELRGRSEADTSVTQSSVRTPVDVSLAATALHAPTSSDVLKKIGRFDLRGVLGSGAFGKAYRAFDSKLNREVAIKDLLEYRISVPAPDRVTPRRFRPEAPTDPYVRTLAHTVPLILDSLRVEEHAPCVEETAGRIRPFRQRCYPFLFQGHDCRISMHS